MFHPGLGEQSKRYATSLKITNLRIKSMNE